MCFGVQDIAYLSRVSTSVGIVRSKMSGVAKRDISGGQTEFAPLYPVLSLLSYMCKAPLVKPGTDVVNSVGRQHNAFDGFLKVCTGLECNNDLFLETRIW